VDFTGTGHVTADVEGLSIYYTNDNRGYLLAYGQGASEYVIYDRLAGNEYIAIFAVMAGNGIDAVSSTYGIDVTNAALGLDFPQGVFIAHDGSDEAGSSNYKLVPWNDISAGAEPELTIDTSWDPRLVGLPPVAAFAANSRMGSAPLTIQFSEQAFGVRSSWLWDFGDGDSSSEANPSRTYRAEGQYAVNLTVSNAFGSDAASKTVTISVGSQLMPTAAFEADVTSGAAPLTVALATKRLRKITSSLAAMLNERHSVSCR
jgi:PKD repeat protein